MNYKKIISGIEFITSLIFLFIFHYQDKLKMIPFLYCEGLGCIGVGIMLVIFGAVILPLLFATVAAMFAEKGKVLKTFLRHLLQMVGYMVVVFAILYGWNMYDVSHS